MDVESHENNHSHGQHESEPSSSISTSHPQENAEQQQQPSGVSYPVTTSILDSSASASSSMKGDVWFCLIVLFAFGLFVSIIIYFSIYGSEELQLGPHCSRLIETNPLFVQSIKAQELGRQKSSSLMLYGFHISPPLDVEITWTETHNALVQVDWHEEWLYFLNKGSKVYISYSIKSPSSAPLSLVIARGGESLEDWIDDPSYPNTTVSWNIIYGNGKIQQEITKSSNYYIAVGNLNSQEVELPHQCRIQHVEQNTFRWRINFV